MFSKNSLTPFFCLIFFFSGFLYAQEDLSHGTMDSLWKSAQHQFEKGQFCKALETVRLLPSKTEDSLGIERRLLEVECTLELEQWDLTAQKLAQLEGTNTENVTTLQGLKIQLLKARLLEKQGKFGQASTLYQRLLEVSPNGKDQKKWYAHVLAYYGSFLYYTEEFDQAEKVLLQAEKRLESNDIILAKCYNGLANLYQQQSQNAFSEEAFEKAKAIWEINGKVNHPGYALLLNDYSLLFIGKNDFETSEALLSKAEAISGGNCPKLSNIAFHEGARAVIRRELGDIDEAESLYQSVKARFQELEQNKEVATILNDLGNIYVDWGDSLDQAVEYFEQALININLAFGKDSPGLTKALILDGLAYTNDIAENYGLADSLYAAEQLMLDAVVGRENVHYSTALNNHAYSYELREEYSKADKLYRESLNIIGQIYGLKHPQYLITLYNLARFYSSVDSTEAAMRYYKKANQLQLELLDNYFSSYDEQTRLQYRLEALGNFDVFFNYACFQNHPGISEEIQNLSLSTKNLVLDYSIQTRGLSEGQSTDKVEKIRKDWEKARRLLSQSYNLGLRERQAYGLSTDSLEQVVSQLETSLIRSLPERFSSALNFSTDDLIKNIKKEEACIDFLTIAYHDGYDFFEDSLFYIALVSKAGDSEPTLIYLTDNTQLEDVFNNYSHYTKNFSASYQLYELIWKPLEPYLEGVKKIHLSPDGLLYQVSFGGLFMDEQNENLNLLDKYEFLYYSNLRDFLTRTKSSKREKSALLIGDPAFSPLNSEGLSLRNPDEQDSTLKDTGIGSYFGRLEGTKVELQKISQQLDEKNYSLEVYQQEDASEEQFKKYLSLASPAIIHIATHGYFLEYDDQELEGKSETYAERLKKTDNAMLRSGLALSNANLVWTGEEIPAGQEDGLLNAQEVAELNLSKTELVVLSACETGLGKVTDGEGVFGLQRAFKLAGTHKLLLSLWKIPDALTVELMDYFYRYLLNGKNAQQALKMAQMKMKQTYPPFYWAGFVLFE